MDSKNSGDQKTESRFAYTVEAEKTGAGMPSVTKLLDRKKLFNPGGSKTQAKSAPLPPKPIALTAPPPARAPETVDLPPKTVPAAVEPPPSGPTQQLRQGEIEAPTEDFKIELEAEPVKKLPTPPVSVAASESSAEVPVARDPMPLPTSAPSQEDGPSFTTETRSSKRRSGSSDQAEANDWSPNEIGSQTEPFAAPLKKLFESGAGSAIVLTQTQPGLYSLAVTVGGGERSGLWQGLRWETSWLADLWKHLSRSGIMEVAPPPEGKVANPAASRNVVRSALGMNTHEWLSVLQLGPENACHTLVLVVSQNSLQVALSNLKGDIRACAPSAAGAPAAQAA